MNFSEGTALRRFTSGVVIVGEVLC